MILPRDFSLMLCDGDLTDRINKQRSNRVPPGGYISRMRGLRRGVTKAAERRCEKIKPKGGAGMSPAFYKLITTKVDGTEVITRVFVSLCLTPP